MTSALSFLVVAKTCEIAELRQLARTSTLVGVTGQLVHDLQRERGLSNLFLAAQTLPQSEALVQQVQACLVAEQALRQCFDQLDTRTLQAGHGSRLFSRIAWVLQGLDALPSLREQVASRSWKPEQAATAYTRLVAGLLAVAFEAADSASDPEISRALVALFNLMQGKEFAGQERATGAAMFASGLASAGNQQRQLRMIESQERCLRVFHDFATARVQSWEAQHQDPANLAKLERMRRILCTASDGGHLDTQMGPTWFACCSQRIDEMKRTGDELASDLTDLCETKIAEAQRALQGLESLLAVSGRPERGAAPPSNANALGFFDDRPPQTHAAFDPSAELYVPQVGRSVFDLIRDQAEHLQKVSDELETVRASLNERKMIERAKGLLMAHRQLSEDDAHKMLRQTAMNQNRRLIDVAEAVLAMADVLPLRSP